MIRFTLTQRGPTEQTGEIVVNYRVVEIGGLKVHNRVHLCRMCVAAPTEGGNGLTRLSYALHLETQEETGKNNTDVPAEDEVSKAFLDKVIRAHNQQRVSAPRPTGSQTSGVLRGQWKSET